MYKIPSMLIGLASLFLVVGSVRADTPPQPQPVEFSQETLDNGLRVIYAPLHTAPVVQVRVLYHVGSRDEKPDRQGFAHMFEHMMFRGSAHVLPEEHMKQVGAVGGICNAFTSFDRTVYHDTLPAEHLEMALYLEADRMSSFKVSENIFKTEREVVQKEWGMKQNQPYGNLYDSLLRTAFTTHSYRWTPIGNMDQLRASRVEELQDFFNTYYVPNNAVLVIAGDIDTAQAKAMVHKYFAWIPRGGDVPRNAQTEPPQTQPREGVDPELVPLAAAVVAWHIPPYRSADQSTIAVLEEILGSGESSRLKKLLVHNAKPLCADADCVSIALEDGGLFGIKGTIMPGRSGSDVESILNSAISDIRDHGVTEGEIAKAKTGIREAEIKSREACSDIATILGDEALIGGDANRVNEEPAKIDAVTAAQVQAFALKYLTPESRTTLWVQPDPLRKLVRKAATQPVGAAEVLPATRPALTRQIDFPPDYPQHAPQGQLRGGAVFAKGVETDLDGVKVIVMRDSRLPTVRWSLLMRNGSHADPAGQEGLAALTARMIVRGAADLSYAQLSTDLDSRGISIDVSDGGDFTRLDGNCTTDQLEHALLRSRQILLQPTLPAAEFDALKQQFISGLMKSQDSPTIVAGQELIAALFSGSALGRHATPATVEKITIDQVRDCYARIYQPTNALLVFSGDVTPEHGLELAKQMLEGWKPAATAPPANYTIGENPAMQVILVDRPDAAQSSVRMGVRAYDIRTDEKFAGSLAGQILSAGIDSRLMKYVRAEKGLAYAVTGIFAPNRYGGTFIAATDTEVRLTADAITAMFKVLNEMRDGDVSPEELTNAHKRVAGTMVMNMQTIGRQADYRVEGILNDYPLDYYDRYAARISQTTAAQVRDVMKKYVATDRFVIVVVGPADKLKDSLAQFGKVEVRPMPAKREGATTQDSHEELMKPAK